MYILPLRSLRRRKRSLHFYTTRSMSVCLEPAEGTFRFELIDNTYRLAVCSEIQIIKVHTERSREKNER